MSKPGTVATWDKQEKYLFMLLRHPAYRRRDFTAGFYKERAKLSSRCQRKIYKPVNRQERKYGSVARWQNNPY